MSKKGEDAVGKNDLCISKLMVSCLPDVSYDCFQNGKTVQMLTDFLHGFPLVHTIRAPT